MALARPQCDGEVEALAKALDMGFPDGMNYDEDMARAKVRPQLIKLQAAKLQQLRALHCSLAFKREHVEQALTIVADRRQADCSKSAQRMAARFTENPKRRVQGDGPRHKERVLCSMGFRATQSVRGREKQRAEEWKSIDTSVGA